MKKANCFTCGGETNQVSGYNPFAAIQQTKTSKMPEHVVKLSPKKTPLITPRVSGQVATIPDVAEHIVYGCNLSCPYCYEFSQWQRGYQSARDVIEFATRISKRIKIPYRALSGGEATLHPQIENIIQGLRKFSRLALWTNGTLLLKQPDTFFDTIKKTGTDILISVHALEGLTSSLPRVIAGLKRLADFGITAKVRHWHNVVAWHERLDRNDLNQVQSQIKSLSKRPVRDAVLPAGILQQQAHDNTLAICPTMKHKPDVMPIVARGRIYYCYFVGVFNTMPDGILTAAQLEARDNRKNFIDEFSTDKEITDFVEHRYENRLGCHLCYGLFKQCGDKTDRAFYKAATQSLIAPKMESLTFDQYKQRVAECPDAATRAYNQEQIEKGERLYTAENAKRNAS